MISLTTTASIVAPTAPPRDRALQRLLDQRVEQLTEDGGAEVGEFAHFLVVGPGDTPADIEAALGFSVIENIVDGARYGDPDFQPSWEWIEQHAGWFELAFVLSDDGFGWVVLIQDSENVDPQLLALCREYASAI